MRYAIRTAERVFKRRAAVPIVLARAWGVWGAIIAISVGPVWLGIPVFLAWAVRVYRKWREPVRGWWRRTMHEEPGR